MPASFHINLPNAEQRNRILDLILTNEPVDSDMNLGHIAAITEGFSGSDLRELCRLASVYRVRDYMRSAKSHSDQVWFCFSFFSSFHVFILIIF